MNLGKNIQESSKRIVSRSKDSFLFIVKHLAEIHYIFIYFNPYLKSDNTYTWPKKAILSIRELTEVI